MECKHDILPQTEPLSLLERVLTVRPGFKFASFDTEHINLLHTDVLCSSGFDLKLKCGDGNTNRLILLNSANSLQTSTVWKRNIPQMCVAAIGQSVWKL